MARIKATVVIQVTCPHGVYPDGTLRWKLTQHRLPGGHIDTIFGGVRGLSLWDAVMQIEGRNLLSSEMHSGQWELHRQMTPGFASVNVDFMDRYIWTGPNMTRHVCDLCELDAAKEGWQ